MRRKCVACARSCSLINMLFVQEAVESEKCFFVVDVRIGIHKWTETDIHVHCAVNQHDDDVLTTCTYCE